MQKTGGWKKYDLRPPSQAAALCSMSPTNSTLDPQPASFASPSVTIILTTIILVCFFIGFFSLYFCRCFMDSIVSSWHLQRTPSGNRVNPANLPAYRGLDPSLIQLFPTFTYSSVKDYRREKYGLECAICLAEFSDDDFLRLLTVCYHVFHQECIDLWLGSHKTCPVCRRDLDLPKETLEKIPTLDQNRDANESNGILDRAIGIAIPEDYGEKDAGGKEERVTHGTSKENDRNKNVGRSSRSHSTGHSILVARGEEDKYTLRLAEHVRVKIVRGHGTARSCITFGEFSSPYNNGSGGVPGSSGVDINKE